MHLYRRTPTGPWYFEVEYGGTRFRESTFERDRREATRVARQRCLEIQAGEPDFRKRRREARLVDLLAKELAEAEARGRATGTRNALASYHSRLLDFFGRDGTLADVTYESVVEFEAWRKEPRVVERGEDLPPRVFKPVRGQSIREEVACLKRAFVRAKRLKLVRTVPGPEDWPEIESGPVDERRKGKLIPLPVLAAILNALDEDVRDELQFAVLTGLRKEELPEVRWSWLEKRRGASNLVVPEASRKAGASYVVPLPPDAAKILTERHMRHRDDDGAELFPRRDWRKRIAKAVEAAGARHIHYRDLRTTYGRLMEKHGGAVVARDGLGHQELDTTSIYMGATLEDRRAASTAIAAELRTAMRGKAKAGGRRK